MCNAYNHPPGCTCGWGGDGHSGSSYGWQGSAPTIANGGTRVWSETNFTRPTHCPECGADVYFIRHNGGSVWVDELGWPWPKHACFDKPTEPTYNFSKWTAKSSGLTNPKLGIIVQISNQWQTVEPRIEIRLPDGSRVTMILRWTPSDSTMLGALVIYSREDSLLLHQIHAEIPFHSFTEKPRMAFGWYQCPRCKATVKEKTGHEEHCRTHFGKPKPTVIPRPTPFQKPKSHFQTKQPPQNPVLSRRKKSLLIYSAKPKHPMVKPPVSQPAIPAISKKLNVDDRIRDAIETIATKAWEAVRGVEPQEEQLRQAKHKALELISMLSPTIKRQVGNSFTSEKWIPLIQRRPAH